MDRREIRRLFLEFETQLEELKRDLERIAALRQELAELGKRDNKA